MHISAALFSKVRNWAGEGELFKALNFLKNTLEPIESLSGFYDQTLALSARLSRLQTKIEKGEVADNVADVSFSQINAGFLALLRKLEKEIKELKNEAPQPESPAGESSASIQGNGNIQLQNLSDNTINIQLPSHEDTSDT